MSKKYYWLKLQKNFFSTRAMKKLRKIAGGEVYTIIYLKLQLLSLNDEGALFSEYIEEDLIDELALEIDEKEDNVRFTLMYLERCGLAEITTEQIILPEVKANIGSESDSARRMRLKRSRDQKPSLCDNAVTASDTEKEKEIEKESINEHFEEVWKLYPKKKGKGQISKTKKNAMLKYSVDEWKDIIARYIADNLDPTYQQHGSTFFNGGYLDYTSENYSRDVKKISEVKAW